MQKNIDIIEDLVIDVPPCFLNDWGNSDNMLAVTDEVTDEEAEVKVTDIGDGEAEVEVADIGDGN